MYLPKYLIISNFRYFSNIKPNCCVQQKTSYLAVYLSTDEKLILNFFKFSNRVQKVTRPYTLTTTLLTNYFTTILHLLDLN